MGSRDKRYTGEARVLVACCDLPRWVEHYSWPVEVIDGRLEYIFIVTKGINVQAEALGDLSRKFGAPASSVKTPMRNGFGATFDAVDASWVNATARIDFKGAVEGTNSGLLVVATPKGRDARDLRAMQGPTQRAL
jgi:hypothetical protein